MEKPGRGTAVSTLGLSPGVEAEARSTSKFYRYASPASPLSPAVFVGLQLLMSRGEVSKSMTGGWTSLKVRFRLHQGVLDRDVPRDIFCVGREHVPHVRTGTRSLLFSGSSEVLHQVQLSSSLPLLPKFSPLQLFPGTWFNRA